MQNLQNELIELLKTQDNLVIDGQLNKNKIIELGLKVEPLLIGLLIKNPTFKKHFFTELESVLVFDKIKFQRFVNNKSFLPDSYTAFKNRIGLAINDDTTDNFIKATNNVVLAWPHKDCVLEGGQTKEDQKRNEIFWNETLAPDNVDRLLDAKAFTNFKKYDKDGEHKVNELKGDENLILKGNNLLVLSSLLKTHRGKIKLIYIDPPYNTGSDSFGYNDNFNHSTWLTFMKNRLVIAKELLLNDGLIFVQCDDNEQAYLKVLMDEVFKPDLFLSQIVWQRTPEGRTALGQGSSFINNSTEYILCYSNGIKPKSSNISKSIDATEKALDQYSYFLKNEGNRELFKIIKDSRNNDINIYKHYDYSFEKIKSEVSSEDRLKYFEFLVRPAAQQKESSLQQKILSNLFNDVLFSVEYVPTSGKSAGSLKKSFYFNNNILLFLKDYSKTDGKSVFRDAAMNDFWSHDEIQVTGISEEGDVILKRGKKPEKLLKRIIEMSTDEKDIVLDYHLGSGTTAAVAHKLNRRFIGIEQLDYGKNDSKQRLINVINAEQSGISKDVVWKGGGSFVYAELLEYNQKYISKIQDSKTKEDVLNVWKEMEDKAFLSIQFNKDIFNERLDAFKTASLEIMQQYLIEILDKNQLYVNFSEIEDETFAVNKEDKALNYSFYKANN